MGDSKKDTVTGIETIMNLKTAEILRDYFLGYKKNGKPRAVYDVIKDQLKISHGGGKKKGKRAKADKFSLYVEPNRKSGKKKKKKNKNKKGKGKKHWEY